MASSLGSRGADGHFEICGPISMSRPGIRSIVGTRETGFTQAPRAPQSGLLLDASAAVSDAALTSQITLSTLAMGSRVLELVRGVDDRIQITATHAAPWRQICALVIEAGDGSLWRGTGWIIGPRTVITAGHCLYLHRRGGWVRRVEVCPGAIGTTRPFGSAIASEFRSVAGWVENEQVDCDYGAIFLPAGVSAAGIGRMRFAEVLSRELEGFVVNIAGYPGDKPQGTLWWDSRMLLSVDGTHLRYEIDTTGGQSGAPVWLVLDGERFAIGIHTLGGIATNSAVKLLPSIFDRLVEWANL